MGGKTRLEQESVILFNEEESTAQIYTHNKRMKKRLSDFCDKYPEEFRLKCDDGGGAQTFIFPKKRVAITSPRKLSPDQKEKARRNLKR